MPSQNKQLKPTDREALRANQVEHLREEDLKEFFEHLRGIKAFHTAAVPGESPALGYFEDVYRHYQLLMKAQRSGVWGTPLDSVDRRLLQYSIRLMKNLSSLQEAMQQLNEDSLFYKASAALWSQSLELMQELLKNSRTYENFAARERKIETLAQAIKKAALVMKSPQDSQVRDELMKAAETMRHEIEGHYLFRQENRLWAGVLGVLGFVIGLTIYLAGIVAAQLSMIGGFTGIVGGVTAMAFFANMIYSAVWPADAEKDELRQERDHSSKFNHSFTELVSLAKNPATFFSAEPPRESFEFWDDEAYTAGVATSPSV